ncbi:MAG: hypothetical protein J2P36_23480, partial [Ktedonobacteraceae bacterium]|nr:hypothetical protein [Ktedonobacteraceae bacterium]
IGEHSWQFLLYRVLLALAFMLLFTLPFALFRIIVAQEIMIQQERETEGEEESDQKEHIEDKEEQGTAMPPYAWRGKGFAIIAAWSGIAGIVVYILGTIASTLYALIVSNGVQTNAPLPAGYLGLSTFFTIFGQTVGMGLLALSTLFFGAMIARGGRNVWPGIWVALGYTALATAALLSGSAVAVASAPSEGQAALTTPAILLFALWVLWLGILLVRLKPEEEA